MNAISAGTKRVRTASSWRYRYRVLYGPSDWVAVTGGKLLPGFDFASAASPSQMTTAAGMQPSDPGDWSRAATSRILPFRLRCFRQQLAWNPRRGMIGALTNNTVGVAGLSGIRSSCGARPGKVCRFGQRHHRWHALGGGTAHRWHRGQPHPGTHPQHEPGCHQSV